MTTTYASTIASGGTPAVTIDPTMAFGAVFIGLAAVAAVWAVRTYMETRALRREQAALAETMALNEAGRRAGRLKASAVLAAAEDRIASNVASSAPVAAAAIAKARGIEGMTVHYVDTQFAPTAPAAFDAKRGAL